jgi:PAS domain S-box-containing protein
MDLRTQDLSKEYTESLFSTIIDLSPMPVYVCAGKDMVVTVANQATLKAWGKDKSVIGKRFKDALPEMKDQPFLGLLLRVYSTGVPYQTDNDRADFLIDGAMRTFYFKFSYQPLKNGDGDIWGVLCIATDVTEFVLANRRAEESERRFKSLILKAPVSLCVLKGPSFIVDVANEGVLKIWGATEEQVSGKPIFEGLPEAKGQGLEELLNKVYTTGEAYTANEKQVDLPGPAGIETKVLNFVYSPYYEMDGNIAGVMAAAIDVTDQVMGRKSVEEVNKKL